MVCEVHINKAVEKNNKKERGTEGPDCIYLIASDGST